MDLIGIVAFGVVALILTELSYRLYWGRAIGTIVKIAGSLANVDQPPRVHPATLAITVKIPDGQYYNLQIVRGENKPLLALRMALQEGVTTVQFPTWPALRRERIGAVFADDLVIVAPSEPI